MISFKGAHFPKDIILHAVFSMSGMPFPIETLKKFWKKGALKWITPPSNGWVVRHSSSLAIAAKNRKRTVATSWRMDETSIKIRGEWVYLYRAVDKFGDTIDFMLSERRDEEAATAFFKQAINQSTLMGYQKK